MNTKGVVPVKTNFPAALTYHRALMGLIEPKTLYT